MESHFPNMETTPSRVARDRIIADMRALARDAEELLKATADDVSDRAKDARTRLVGAIERAKGTYEQLQTDAMESARVAMTKADTTIRTHPYESLGVAFGVGVLLGVLIRRR